MELTLDFLSTFTELRVHSDERRVTSNTYFRGAVAKSSWRTTKLHTKLIWQAETVLPISETRERNKHEAQGPPKNTIGMTIPYFVVTTQNPYKAT